MDTELFELCKEVYEKTGWEPKELNTLYFTARNEKGEQIPRYTSDYLLEKLPPRIQDEDGNYFSLMGFPNGIQPWFAYQGNLEGEDRRWPIDEGIPYYKRVFQSNTPLKALLKLTVALQEKGELNV